MSKRTPSGKRRPERPKGTWRRAVKTEMKENGHTWKTIGRIAQYGNQWRDLVVALCVNIQKWKLSLAVFKCKLKRLKIQALYYLSIYKKDGLSIYTLFTFNYLLLYTCTRVSVTIFHFHQHISCFSTDSIRKNFFSP
jgi:hypothetical protein